MIKRFVILRKKPSMSVEEFRQYWKNVHGPLISKIPGLLSMFNTMCDLSVLMKSTPL